MKMHVLGQTSNHRYIEHYIRHLNLTLQLLITHIKRRVCTRYNCSSLSFFFLFLNIVLLFKKNKFQSKYYQTKSDILFKYFTFSIYAFATLLLQVQSLELTNYSPINIYNQNLVN